LQIAEYESETPNILLETKQTFLNPYSDT